MKKILVTGGCGFIGSWLVRRLLATPGVEEVRVLDDLSVGEAENLPCDLRLFFTSGAVCGPALFYSVKDCDAVFHLAANADIAKAATDPTVDFYGGTVLTQNLLEAMRVSGVKRIFYTSGSGVYGDWGTHPVRETTPCQPVSAYGASKLASEALISSYAHMFGFKASVFRFANVVGPRQTHGVGHDFIRKLRADPTKLEILGDGTQSKSYVHVDDVLDAVMAVAEQQDSPFDVWNVASEGHTTVREIAQLAAEVMGLQPEFRFGTSPRGWKGDVPVVRIDYGKIQRHTGWSPRLTSHAAVGSSLIDLRNETA